jgi:2-oxoglutarate dehydrogenase E1 component
MDQSNQGSHPGSQRGSQRGPQAGSHPGSQTGSDSGSPSDSQPGSRPQRADRPAAPAPPVAGGFDPLVDFGVNAAVAEDIRARFAEDPGSVDPAWAAWFTGKEAPVVLDEREAGKHGRALRLIHSYRARGHRIADIDPLGGRPTYFPELDPAHYGFGREDLGRSFLAGDLPGGPVQPLAQILERLRDTYCGKVGVEFTHIQDPGRKAWLQRRLEETRNRSALDAGERERILQLLSASELFERFLHTRFLGQKRFGLEGAESLIPLLDTLVEQAPEHGIREFVIGMAHRGRLNVLSNILGKSYEMIFSEFEDIEDVDAPFGSGDVKYHKGYSSDRRTRSGGRVHLSLTANPSHLEAVDPVVEGRVRAKQVANGDPRGRSVLPLLIHGDAAFAGQGMVAETLNLSKLVGYSTGGSVHVVVNNQIGFTTTPTEARSTLYCTDVAKMIQVPIFHVNGDDPEAVVHVARLALEYRQRFADDVVIDLVCYRRHGHNEADEPNFTQPLLYEKIRERPSVRSLYTDELIESGVLRPELAQEIETVLSDQLQQALASIEVEPPVPDEPYEPRGTWMGFERRPASGPTPTGVPIERLAEIAERIAQVPPGFEVHRKLRPFLERRAKAIPEDGPVDWAFAEALAFGSLLLEGYHVRLSGQDCSRGTFSHRHAVLVDQESEVEYAPLAHLSATQGRFEVYDSLLSEAAVLGFEYGYSVADPMSLVLWEAQFGDFANGAQVIIDQFVSSAAVKWGRLSGLVLLLPHGYEGQGPEHSSARIERYLQLCAEGNLQVVNCTTPAQYFHVLRRQMRRNYRAPLVVFTPKSLLRAPFAVSKPGELASGHFLPVIPDAACARAPDQVRRALFCSGKVYYDLVEAREKRGEEASTAIVRVEQLYPWDGAGVRAALEPFGGLEQVIWVQEEPRNMGPWTFVRERLETQVPKGLALRYVGRKEAAAPSGGSMRLHKQRQAKLLFDAFTD